MTDYLYVCFVRIDGCNNVRGEIAGKPRGTFPLSHKNLIVCKIDPILLTSDVIQHRSTVLKLNELQLRYPNTTREVVDEGGNIDTIDVYGYFDIQGRSSEKDCPVITLADVELGEVS